MAIAFSFFALRSEIFSYARLSELRDGNSVCFSRVVQTFTAKMIGPAGGQYLTPSFISMSGECYGDMVDNASHDADASLQKVGSQINQVASDVHWFHDNLNRKVITIGAAQGNSLSSMLENRFQKVEALNDAINEKLDELKRSNLKNFATYASFLLLSLLALVTAALYSFFRELSLEKFRQRMESVAATQTTSPVQAKGLIAETLEKHGYQNCAQLLKGQKIPSQKREETKHQAPLKKVQLTPLIEKIFIKLKNQISHYGITIHTHVPENLFARGSADVISQVIYDLITSHIRELKKVRSKPTITVKAQAKGGQIDLTLSRNGGPFQKDWIHRLKKKTLTKGLPIELVIARELLGDVQGKIQLSNKNDGPEVQIVLKRAGENKLLAPEKSPSRTTRRLVRGKKSKVLADFASSRHQTP